MANKERILKAIDDLEAQGDYGFYNGQCSYHTSEGKRCIVGLMLHSPEASDEGLPTVSGLLNAMGGGSVAANAMSLDRYRKLLHKLGNMSYDEMEFLAGLQYVHDRHATARLPLSECVVKLRELVEEYYEK